MPLLRKEIRVMISVGLAVFLCVVSGALGILAMAMCAVAGNADERAEWMLEKRELERDLQAWIAAARMHDHGGLVGGDWNKELCKEGI